MDKIQRVQDDLAEATDLMRANIEAVVDRGEHLELLVDKSDSISNNARQFQKQSVGLRKALFWKNVKLALMLLGVLTAIATVVAQFFCGWLFTKCLPK